MAGPHWPAVARVEFMDACPGCGERIFWRQTFPHPGWVLEGPCACTAA